MEQIMETLLGLITGTLHDLLFILPPYLPLFFGHWIVAYILRACLVSFGDLIWVLKYEGRNGMGFEIRNKCFWRDLK